MQHQDWNSVTLNRKDDKQKVIDKKEVTKSISSRQFNHETTKLEAPKNLGQLIAQARTSKGLNQDSLSKQLCISKIIINKWETNKETPNNADIAKLEKFLGVKLPRCKKIKIINE
tara:strand:+ start:10093 stop:10437 length:345 start_codon:yes stop_codon:yes gene_type:complete